jgi:hypothetical protein
MDRAKLAFAALAFAAASGAPAPLTGLAAG